MNDSRLAAPAQIREFTARLLTGMDYEPDLVTFIGRKDYFPTQQAVTRFCADLFPVLLSRRPGTQYKILKSMAMGVPVVCSKQASGGVDAVPGEHLLACETRAQMIEAIPQVLGSRELRGPLATTGRARVLSNLSWPSSMQRLDALIASQFQKRVAA